MAITIIHSPDNYSPAYSPLLYVVEVSGGLETEASFRYIADLFVGAEKIARLKSVPHPEYGWGQFDISGIVQNLLELQKSWTDGIFTSRKGWESVKVEFGYEYISSAGAFIQVLDSADQTRVYFNGSPSYNEFIELQEFNPYVLTGTATDKYAMTERREIYTAPGTKQWLYYLNNNHNYVRNIEIEDIASGEVDQISIPSALRNNADGKMVAFRVDKEYLKTQSALVIGDRYSIQTLSDTFAVTSQPIYFNMKGCGRWELYSLYYLNRWGGVDSFSFDGKAIEQVTARRETYGRSQPRIQADGTVDWDAQLHTERIHHSTYESRYRLTSGWIGEDEQVTLRDLLSSPLVWMEDPNGSIQPVIVDTGNMDIQNRRDGTIMARIEVRKPELNKRQKA